MIYIWFILLLCKLIIILQFINSKKRTTKWGCHFIINRYNIKGQPIISKNEVFFAKAHIYKMIA